MSRLSLLGPALLFSVHVASAATAPNWGLAPIPANIPGRCAVLAQVPASARIPEPAIDARISIANCTAEEALSRLTIRPDNASVQEMNRAVAPSLAMLDDVIAHAPPDRQLIAQDAKRDLFQGLIVRTRSSLHHADITAQNRLDPLVTPWQDEAHQAQMAMRELVRTHPQLAQGDQVVAPLAGHAAG